MTGQFRLQSRHVYDMAVTESGEMLEYAKTEMNEYEVLWYSVEGRVKHRNTQPGSCQHPGGFHSILSVNISQEEFVALSCCECHTIWVWRPDATTWKIAWRKMTNTYQLRPWKLCRYKPGMICVVDDISGNNMSVFDITRIPFCVVRREIKLGMMVEYLSFDKPDAEQCTGVAVTNGEKLCMYNLTQPPSLLWSTDNYEDRLNAVCTDKNKGIVFATSHNKSEGRIFVFAADTGKLLKKFKHKNIEQPRDVFWCEKIQHLIVRHNQCMISHFDIKYPF